MGSFNLDVLTRRSTPLEITEGVFVFSSLKQNKADSDLSADTDFIIPTIAGSGLGVVIHDYSFLSEVIRTFGLFRLSNITQLEYLEDPDEPPLWMESDIRFHHTRFLHSLNVWAIALAISEVNKSWFDERPGFREALQVAALTHDVLTPAGGDTTKAIDPVAFDEDLEYNNAITDKRRQFLAHHGVDPDLCIKTVLGKGVLGTILDIADKLAYTGHDTNYFGNKPILGHWPVANRGAIEKELRKTRGKACTIWQSVRIHNDVVWNEDTNGLTNFLVLRGMMFRHLYTNPKARYKEALIMYSVLSFLYETRKLTRPQLLDMNDNDLQAFVNQQFNWGYGSLSPSQQGFIPTYKRFRSWDEACEFERKLLREGHLFVRAENLIKIYKPGHHLKVRFDGQIDSLLILFPKQAAEAQKAGEVIDPIRVSYLIGNEPSLGSMTDAFRTWRTGQLHR
jgi:hypothetical protein